MIFSAIPKSRSSEDNVMGVSFTPQGARDHAQLISLFFAKDNPKDILAKGVVILLFAGVRSYSLGTAALLHCMLQQLELNPKQGFAVTMSVEPDSFSQMECAASTASLIVAAIRNVALVCLF